ncbi:hypothetical protein EB796_023450 [Bugula neritina]|uniref:Uncharacterized protein n=1 Tax=Bugula neritina TaxID=10212 RepID=A0A7J7IWE5_BUGNE|nr:hypothetical protein EB796_023450 [Bugula neritina]
MKFITSTKIIPVLCLALASAFNTLNAEDAICQPLSQKALEKRLLSAKNSPNWTNYPVKTFNQLYLHQIDPEDEERPDRCTNTSSRRKSKIFHFESYPGWYRTTWSVDFSNMDAMPIYPNLLVHNKCCDNTCYIPSGIGKSQPGIVKQRLEDTIVLQQKNGCTSAVAGSLFTCTPCVCVCHSPSP